jgi:acetyltransferase
VERAIELDGRRVTLRPLRAADAGLHRAFIASLATEDLRFRFGDRVVSMSDAELERLARVDPERERIVVATLSSDAGAPIVGEVRILDDAEGASAEFAIAVRSDLQGRGVGRALLESAIADCRARGLRVLYGLVDPANGGMLALASRLGFDIDHVPGGSTAVVWLAL